MTKMQNAMLLSFMLGGHFSFPQEFKNSLEIQNLQRIAEITLTATKIGQVPPFTILDDISGSRQSKINFLIYFLLTNCRNKKKKTVHVSNLNFHIHNEKRLQYLLQVETRPKSGI